MSLAVQRIPFSELPGFSRLFTDYCENFDRLRPHFAADYSDADARPDEIARILTRPRDRQLLAEVLLEQNENWALDDRTREHIELLSSPRSAAVVTGQQVGLFGGPLYTVYKTATAIKVAAEWSTETHPVVPVFWLEGEDHDLDEVSSIRLLGREGPFEIGYDAGDPPTAGNHGPVGRLKFRESIRQTIDELYEGLPPTDFRDEIIDRLRAAYDPGTSFRDAFARFLKSLFPSSGLVFISPDHRRLKEAAIPLFRKEIEQSHDVVGRVEAAGAILAEDYHAQVRARPTNLFYIDDLGRSVIDVDESAAHYSIRNHKRQLRRNEIFEMLDDDPCAFSPNVVLRPILQDLLLPTAAYIAGPGEVAYLAQLKSVYEWAEQPMPVVHPRASITVVEARIRDILSKYSLELPDVGTDLERLFKRVVLDDMDVDLPARFEHAARLIDSTVEEVRDIVVSTDATLEKALEATRSSMRNEWRKLQGRVLKAEKRRHGDDRRRLERAQSSLYPNGSLQERSLSIITFLNKYGLRFVDELMSVMSTDTRNHQIILVES